MNPSTIFSHPFPDSPEEGESKKVSYWLQKLFDQEEQKNSDDKKEKELADNKVGVHSLETQIENKSPPQLQQREKSPEEKGLDESNQNLARKKENDKQVVSNLVRKSNRILLKISSSFPFEIFPKSITVEESRVTVVFSQLFSSQVHSVDIKDNSNVFIESDLFFSTLTIVSRTFIENDIKISKLKKGEARHVRSIIEGLRVFIDNDIDTCNYEVKELVEQLESLSTN